jgi:hypothetical protein
VTSSDVCPRQEALVASGCDCAQWRNIFRLYSYQQLMRVVCVLQHLERKSFAIGLGCELTHAHKLVYTAGVDLADAETSVAIGAGCKVCDGRPAPSGLSRSSADQCTSTHTPALPCRIRRQRHTEVPSHCPGSRYSATSAPMTSRRTGPRSTWPARPVCRHLLGLRCQRIR